MSRAVLVAGLLAGLVFASCSSSTPPETLPDAGVEEMGGDFTIVDLQPTVTLPTVLNLTAAGGNGQSDSFRMRFVISGPISAGNGSSDSFQIQSGAVIAAPKQ